MKIPTSSTTFSKKDVRSLIETRLSLILAPISLIVNDESILHAGHVTKPAGGHFSVMIISSMFNGKSKLTRHRIVYDALSDIIQSSIHALSIRTYTLEEFNKNLLYRRYDCLHRI
ncbi:MAG: BolA family protein [Burkholderia sp.]|nr:BolA family protein [Burkholderia sp.]